MLKRGAYSAARRFFELHILDGNIFYIQVRSFLLCNLLVRTNRAESQAKEKEYFSRFSFALYFQALVLYRLENVNGALLFKVFFPTCIVVVRLVFEDFESHANIIKAES